MKKIFLTLLISGIISNIVIAQNDNIYTAFIANEIAAEKFTKKGDDLVRQYAAKFVTLYNSGTLYEVFSYDAVNNSFSIDKSKMPSYLLSYNWNGSQTTVKRNMMGQFSGEDEQYYNSIIAYWTTEFIRYYPKEVKAVVKKTEISISKDIFSFVAKNYYGGNKELCWTKWSAIKNLEQRKTKMIQYSIEFINAYLSGVAYDTDKYIYIDLDEVYALKRALENNDWTQIEAAANKLGWTYDTYLYY